MMDVLLIHGLSGSTADMQFIGDSLGGTGQRVINIGLPGHGTRPEDLLAVRMQEWIDAAAAGIDACPQGCFIVGQSMGALLALYGAVRYPGRVRGLALLAPAIRLSGGFNRLFMSLLHAYAMVLPVPALYYTKANGADIADPAAKDHYGAYNKIAFNALVQFERLRRLVLKLLPGVCVPVLTVSSVNDHTIARNAVEIIDRKIGSTIKKNVVFSGSFHVLSVDRDKEGVVASILEFQRFIKTGVI